MLISTIRSIEPSHMSVTVDVTTDDVVKAFDEAADPDEALYYALFGPAWNKLNEADKLAALSQLAQLVSGTRAAVFKVNFTAPERK